MLVGAEVGTGVAIGTPVADATCKGVTSGSMVGITDGITVGATVEFKVEGSTSVDSDFDANGTTKGVATVGLALFLESEVTTVASGPTASANRLRLPARAVTVESPGLADVGKSSQRDSCSL